MHSIAKTDPKDHANRFAPTQLLPHMCNRGTDSLSLIFYLDDLVVVSARSAHFIAAEVRGNPIVVVINKMA